MKSLVHIDDVSIKFRRHSSVSRGIKESLVGLVTRDEHKKRNSEFWGLQNVSLRLETGDRLGIVGHNGAGKSTLLKIISRIYRPTAGELTVRGRVVPLIEIGAGFNPELSGRENVYLNTSILGVPRKQIAQRMEAIAAAAELEDHFEMPVKYYSTGMNLRLAFAIAMEITPDILILDEMFAGGDAAFIQRATRQLEQYVAKSNIFIMVSHDLEYLRRYCNRCVWLDQGKVRMDSNPDTVLEAYLKAMEIPPQETPGEVPLSQ